MDLDEARLSISVPHTPFAGSVSEPNINRTSSRCVINRTNRNRFFPDTELLPEKQPETRIGRSPVLVRVYIREPQRRHRGLDTNSLRSGVQNRRMKRKTGPAASSRSRTDGIDCRSRPESASRNHRVRPVRETGTRRMPVSDPRRFVGAGNQRLILYADGVTPV